MKKLNAIIIAMALVLGLGQCKKQETPTSNNTEDGIVYITVKVGNGGAKHAVYPNHGLYAFDNGDILYVGNNGHFVGTLEYQDGAFSGGISSPSTSDYLHFYFLGGKTPADAPEAGTTTSFTISIADQSDNLPILSYGRSDQLYNGPDGPYSTTLRNKFGLVKFVPATATAEAVTISGMKNAVTVDFSIESPGITSTGTTGNVTLYSESNTAKWAVLLPQDVVSAPTVTIDGYSATIASVPAVTENMLYTTGVNIAMTVMLPYIDAEFSVAENTTVKFSRGNLQYNMTTGMFSFMEHQYSTVEILGQDVGVDYANQNIVSLFGYATSGCHVGNTCYQPYHTRSRKTWYGYNSSSITNSNCDWGVYNKQSNQNKIEKGGDHDWHILHTDEWNYVFFTRDTPSGHRYTKATVCGVNGAILLPDNWSDDTYPLINYDNPNAPFTGSSNINSIDAAGWATLEGAGCVFLPTAGRRYGGGDYSTTIQETGSSGYYWTSRGSDNGSGDAMGIQSNTVGINGFYRYEGCSVRLVF